MTKSLPKDNKTLSMHMGRTKLTPSLIMDEREEAASVLIFQIPLNAQKDRS